MDIEIQVVLGEYNRRFADLTQEIVIKHAENVALKNRNSALELEIETLRNELSSKNADLGRNE